MACFQVLLVTCLRSFLSCQGPALCCEDVSLPGCRAQTRLSSFPRVLTRPTTQTFRASQLAPPVAGVCLSVQDRLGAELGRHRRRWAFPLVSHSRQPRSFPGGERKTPQTVWGQWWRLEHSLRPAGVGGRLAKGADLKSCPGEKSQLCFCFRYRP